MPPLNYPALGAYAAALAATLVLAAWLTPAHWWRRPTMRSLAIVAGGTWAIGSLLMGLVQAPAIAATRSAMTAPPPAMAIALAGRSYRVRDDLNLRTGTGIGSPRIAVVPAGTLVTTTGQRDGDWWQLSARIEGREVLGWSSSLWLRRAEEAKH